MKLYPFVFGILLLCFAFPVVAQEGDYTIHVVQRGENLFRIALGYGLSTDELATLNGVDNPASIRVGQRLLVPSTGLIEDGSTARAYEVQPGDTFMEIAELYDVSVEALQAQNPSVGASTLAVGVILEIPTTADEIDSVTEDANEIAENVPSGNRTSIHVVQSGETLFRISQQYGLDVNELAQANAIFDPTRIYAGQQLLLPGVSPPQLAVTLPAPLTEVYLMPQLITEGKSAYVEMRSSAPVSITGTFLEQAVSAFQVEGEQYRLILAAPVFIEPGIYPLDLVVESDSGVTDFSVNLQVIQGAYGSERINLIEGRDTLLDNNVETAELELLQRITAPYTPEVYLQDKMSLPAAAAITSGFGTRRSYNGGAFDRFHSGTDFAGVPGTPILAPAPGRVVLADTLNVRGNATVIDHGLGIYTGYWHQSEIYVQVGEFVDTGQVIGTIGSTGRVTGAHLHWELWVNGIPVDPMQWVQQSFVSSPGL